jgi:hypothetical protein
MASFIIELLKTLCGGRLGHAYYYCHYSHQGDEGLPFLKWILGQLCCQAGYLPQELKRLNDNGCEPTIREVLAVLEAALPSFDVVYVIIDAVDESRARSNLLSVLTTLATDARFQKVQLLATSRTEYDIEKAFSGISTNTSMSNEFVEEDIRTVVHEWITTSPQMRRWADLSKSIEDSVCSGAQGMYVEVLRYP